MKYCICLLYFIFALYLVFAPYFSLAETSMYDSKRLLEIVILILGGTVLLFKVKREKVSSLSFGRRVVWVFIIFFAMGVLSSLTVPMPFAAWREIAMFGTILFIIVLLGISITENIRQYQLFVILIAISYVGIYSIYFLGNYISALHSPLVPLWPDRLGFAINVVGTDISTKEVLNFVNRRFFNQTQTWTFPLLAAALVYVKKQKVYYWLLLFFISIWWTLVIASGARGTTISVIVSVIFIYIFWKNKGRDYAKGLLYSALCGGLIYFFLYYLFIPVQGIGDSLVDGSIGTRSEMWEMAFSQFVSNPFLGSGPYHFSFVSGEEVLSKGHPHNFYLQILSEWGIIAFLAFCVLLILFVKWLITATSVRTIAVPQELHIGFVGSIVAALTHAFFSGVFHTPMSQVWFIVIMAYFMGLYLNTSKRRTDQSDNFEIRLSWLKAGLVSSIIVLSTLSIYEFRDLKKSYELHKEKFETTRFSPRFWGQGLIYKTEEKETREGK